MTETNQLYLPEFGAPSPEVSEPAREFTPAAPEVSAPVEDFSRLPNEFASVSPPIADDRRASAKEKRRNSALMQFSSALLCAALAVSALGSSMPSQSRSSEYDHAYYWSSDPDIWYAADYPENDLRTEVQTTDPLYVEIGWKGKDETLGIVFDTPETIQDDVRYITESALHDDFWGAQWPLPEQMVDMENLCGAYGEDSGLSLRERLPLDGHYEISFYRPTPGPAISAYVRVVQHGKQSVYHADVTQDESSPLKVCAFDFVTAPDDYIPYRLSYDPTSYTLTQFFLDAYWDSASDAMFTLEFTGSEETRHQVQQLREDEVAHYYNHDSGTVSYKDIPLADFRILSSASLPVSYAVTMPELPTEITPPQGRYGLRLRRVDDGTEPVEVKFWIVSTSKDRDNIVDKAVTLRAGETIDVCSISFD